MPSTLEQLVHDTIALTGSPGPALLAKDAVALRADDAAPFYLVGLIGGKEVGKSSLVNALAGKEIATVTSYGEGTSRATAYAHHDVIAPLRALLERDVPGQYTIVPHEESSLRRQVLLDLPDIDSRFAAHVQLTRTLLRRMLYPLWVQSIEKYADALPQQMLREVAEGNHAANFLFCLTKADQLKESGDADVLREDFAARIARTLKLPEPPGVFVISARAADRFDLAALRKQLSKERSSADVSQSLARAGEQQDRTLAAWIAEQDLPDRAARAARQHDDARQLLQDRVGAMLLENVLPQLVDDPLLRAGIASEVFDRRIDRWPIVRLLNLALSPAVTLAETLVRGRGAVGPGNIDHATRIDPITAPLAKELQAAMAHLRQSTPTVAPLLDHDRLWETPPAEAAVGRLRDRLALLILQRRAETTAKLSRNFPGSGIGRWLATVGAALWFPIVQPVLEVTLGTGKTYRLIDLAQLAVSLLSGAKLLQDAAFLAIWFVLLWLLVRYRTFSQTRRFLSARRGSLDLATASDAWMSELLAPLARQRDRLADLANRAK